MGKAQDKVLDGSGEEQSSDRVMVRGFQTLSAATVGKVGQQSGVADAVGGLSLQVVKVSGRFTRGRFQQDSSGGGPDAGGRQPGGEVQGVGVEFATADAAADLYIPLTQAQTLAGAKDKRRDIAQGARHGHGERAAVRITPVARS